jgi:cytochrome c peroxidase
LLIFLAACAPIDAACAADASTAPPFEWRLPPGFPRPAVPADNPMSIPKVELGRRLFFDTRLSATGQYSCASCHRPELAFTDGRSRAQGATGESTRRGALSLGNVAYSPALTWADARVRSLESQMRQPLFNEHPVEMGLQNGGVIAVLTISQAGGYAEQFAAAFPSDVPPLSMDNIIKAIAAFERTLISGRSAFDRYVFDDDRTAMSDSARRGMALFFSARVGCAQCHFGINFSGPVIYQGHERGGALFANTGLYDVDGRGGYPRGDRGLMEITHRAEDMGKFRVPTLRNVALTAPYMHDGSLSSLQDVLDHYMRGGNKKQGQDSRIRPFALTETERSDMVAFLDSLTDPDFIENPQFRPR